MKIVVNQDGREQEFPPTAVVEFRDDADHVLRAAFTVAGLVELVPDDLHDDYDHEHDIMIDQHPDSVLAYVVDGED